MSHTAATPQKIWPLTLASLGVVYGDIGTSPLYALKESLAHAKITPETFDPLAVYGIASLILWTLLIVATFKYIAFILRADNKGEGGLLSLMALVQRALGHRTPQVLFLGMLGGALFYGDALITPAISVMSAMEGLTLLAPTLQDYVLPGTLAILVVLFMVQKHGTTAIARFFGPIMLVWFGVLLLTGLWHIIAHPEILKAVNPVYAWHFLQAHGIYAVLALGGVFLVVTGTETMYADLGHFGRPAITRAWVSLVLPALGCNYLGQAALILNNPATLEHPFFSLVPESVLPFFLILATIATIIASQAVISGAFSVTKQAVNMGLLPRLAIHHTSEHHAGQIYVPKINWLLMAGVMLLVFTFQSSSALAAAYGSAISATMLITSLFCFVVFYKIFKWNVYLSVALSSLFILVDFTFFAVNLSKLMDGGWLPLAFAGLMVMVMRVWTEGTIYVTKKTKHTNMPWESFLAHVEATNPHVVEGTAIYMTSDLSTTPTTLTTNLELNKVLHAKNLIVSVEFTPTPTVPAEERISLQTLPSDKFLGVQVLFGYAETPNLSRTLGYHLKKHGIDVEIGEAIFIIGHHTFKMSPTKGLAWWKDYIFMYLNRQNTPPTDYFHLPPSRVLELSTQLVI